MKFKKFKNFFLIGCIILILGSFQTFALDNAADGPPSKSIKWDEFVKQIRIEALAQGIRPEVFDEAFRDVKAPHAKVMGLYRSQPEKRLVFLKYRDTRADAFRIKLGRSEYKKNAELLNKIGEEYGVNPCFIVSFWGLETSYGRYMGNFPVIKSLATLAYDNPRYKFFRQQLFYALQILNEKHVQLKDFHGEWAGASGQPQFLPSSWHNYAVDYDHDGRKDIWKALPDVFASIANYLKQHGWKRGEPWAIEVQIPQGFDQALLTRSVTKPISEWRQMGIQPMEGYQFPSENLQASVIYPDGGPGFMIFNNFKVIMKWNNSTYYAGTVGYMAEEICRSKALN